MILKASDGRSGDIEVLESLLKGEITADQRRAIEAELYTIRKGAEGERETAHILDRIYGHSERVAVIHDLRLPDGLNGYVQFDHLLLNRVLKRIAVLETKNFSGRISKNEHNEWCVWYQNRRQPVEIPNPVAQADRAARLLELWLEASKHSAAFRRVEGWVIVPPTCKIDRTRIGTGTRIVKVDNFHERWIEDVSFSDATGFLTGLSVGQLRAVGMQLASQHVPPAYAWRRRFGINDIPNRAVASTLRPEIQAAKVATEPEPELETKSETVPGAATVPPEGQDCAPIEEQPPVVDSRPEPADQSATDEEKMEPSPTRTKTGAKASALVTVTEGISERVLPDGRIAFLAQPGTPAAEQLTGVCKGRAIWNPRFRNWLCSAERAEEIRHALGTLPAGERT
ncbi:nuclease-related domain-containing protein [Erythrobacter donghaensis]|uniref:nuclease-related domain-containing protein n=1 Tax=Erythrobacter donghaensis TaxID=267135 RepID=UPI00093DE8C5|nr:nuclease-related domain-containing protein [Erythrobacter donghaensis]